MGNVLVSSRLGERRYKHDINGTLYLQDIIFPNIHTKFMIFLDILSSLLSDRRKMKEQNREQASERKRGRCEEKGLGIRDACTIA